MRKVDIPEDIKHSAMLMAVITHKLGYGGDKLPGLIERANKFYETAVPGDAVEALEDDLDAWSVAVGFSAALGAYAACSGATCAYATDIEKQMQKAEDN